jgi:hypothetical protein
MNGPRKLRLVRETLSILDANQVFGGIVTTSQHPCVQTDGCPTAYRSCQRTCGTICAITLTEGANCTATRDESLGVAVCNPNTGSLAVSN